MRGAQKNESIQKRRRLSLTVSKKTIPLALMVQNYAQRDFLVNLFFKEGLR